MRSKIWLPPVDDEQRKIIYPSRRFGAIAWGRRRGKSAALLFRGIMTAAAGGTVWWVWPTLKMSRPGWKMMLNLGGQLEARGIARLNRSDKSLVFNNGGELQMKSAEVGVFNVGDAVDGAIIDEGALIRPEAVENDIMPALMDREGWLLIAGAPMGTRGYFYSVCEMARSGLDPDWFYTHQTTFDSPYVPESEKQRIRAAYIAGRILPRYYESQYMAQFVADSGAVFTNVLECIGPDQLEEREEGRTYYVGVDWGKFLDLSWFVVIDDLCRVVYLERMSRIDYVLQARRLKVVHDTWRPAAIRAESNAMGTAVIEQVERMGIEIDAWEMGGTNKVPLLDDLAIAFRTKGITIPPDTELIAQLQAFEMQKTKGGKLTYAAAAGTHDDGVIGLALAYSCAKESAGVGSTLI